MRLLTFSQELAPSANCEGRDACRWHTMSSVRPPSRPQGSRGNNFIHRYRPDPPAARSTGGVRKVRVLMGGWLVALIALIPLLAFGMWLAFNIILVRWYGLDALKATPPIYKVFLPREWFKVAPPSDSPPPASQQISEVSNPSQDPAR
jgi:hypothetical protein